MAVNPLLIKITLLAVLLQGLPIFSQTLNPEYTSEEPDYNELRSHPRLIITESRVEELKDYLNTDTLFQSLYSIIEFYADSALKDPLIAYKFDGPGNPRLKYQRRHAMLRVFNCGLMYQMTGDTIYAARVRDELLAAASFPDWGPDHFLNIGEISALTGIGYDWVYDFLTEEDKKKITSGASKHGLKEGLSAYNGTHQNGWWVNGINNWNQVCNGGLTLLALAVAEEKPDTAKLIVDHAVSSITRAMSSYIPEGAWHEGPTYWAYGTTYNGMMLSALRTTFGHLMGLEKDPGYIPMGKSGLFHIHTAGPTGLYFNYGDSKRTLYYSPVLFWMSHEFDEPAFAWFERLTIKKDLARMQSYELMNDDTLDRFLALLAAWYSDTGKSITYNDFAHDIAISSGETAVGAFHSSWKEDAIYLGFKGGTPNTNHAHMDIGSYVLDALGERWAMDLGTGDNSLPGYYDRNGNRWDYFRTQNMSHNTLTLAGRLQAFNGFADLYEFYSDPNYAFAKIDMSALYPIVGKTTRSFEMKDRERIVITDRIEQSFEYLPIRWQMITDAEIALNNSEAILKKNNKALKIRIIHPADVEFSILSTDAGDERQRSNVGTQMLAVEYTSMNTVMSEISVEFIPGDSTFSNLSTVPDIFSPKNIHVYPNPFSSEISVDMTNIRKSNGDITIFNYAGKKVYFQKLKNIASEIWSWDGKNMAGMNSPEGMYLIKINSDGETWAERIVRVSP